MKNLIALALSASIACRRRLPRTRDSRDHRGDGGIAPMAYGTVAGNWDRVTAVTSTAAAATGIAAAATATAVTAIQATRLTAITAATAYAYGYPYGYAYPGHMATAVIRLTATVMATAIRRATATVGYGYPAIRLRRLYGCGNPAAGAAVGGIAGAVIGSAIARRRLPSWPLRL